MTTLDPESRFHAEWLGLVQPVEGLVVSVPVLADAQCMRRQPLALQQRPMYPRFRGNAVDR